MSLSKTWNGTSYSIPEAGEINWAALTNFLADLADNAQTTNFQVNAVRVATTTPVSVSAATDHTIISDLASAGAVAVNLPAGASGQTFVIVDGKGDADTNNITVTPDGAEQINGAANFVISRPRAGIMIQFDGTEWKIISEFVQAADGISPGEVTGGTANYVAIYDSNGALSEEQELAKSRGGSGQDNSSLTFPSAGKLAKIKEYDTTWTSETSKDVDVSTDNINALKCQVEVLDINNDYKTVFLAVTRPDANTVRLSSGSAISGDYRVVVTGAA